ncbi:MAG: PAS domain S-box protein [Candidatus Latescibacteria bacterium]|nr:PAS domain S-box protein [Candidatus Latescibacterota bacterium]
MDDTITKEQLQEKLDALQIRMDEVSKSENTYRLLFQNSLEGIGVSKEFRIIDANNALLKILGYDDINEIKEHPFLEFIVPEDRLSIQAKIAERMKGDTSYNHMIFKMIRKDGKIIDVETAHIGMQAGEERFTLSSFRDITEKVKTEDELRRSEELYRITLSNISDAVFITDETGVFTFVCPNVDTIFGYTHEEVSALANIALLLGDKLFDPAELKNSGELQNIAWDIVDKKGDKHNLLVNVKSVAIKGGTILYTCRDITELKRVEKKILDLAKFPGENPNPVLRISKDGEIIYANRGSEPLLKYWKCQVGQVLSEIFKRKITEVFCSGLNSTEEIEFENNVYSLTYTPLHETNYINIYGYDITQQRKLEERLQIREHLDSLGTLAGGIAHDFNNLLAVIFGNIELLRSEAAGFTDEQREFLDEASYSCRRAAMLIKNIQFLSKGVVEQTTDVDLYQTIKNVFEFLDDTPDKNIEKIIHIRPGEYIISGKPDQLHQAFLHLGSNALEAIQRKDAKTGDFIKISAEECHITANDRRGLSPGKYVHIFFEDTGTGMTERVKRKAFDPLFTTKERSSQKGQGLGLAIVYNIVTRMHEGFIEIESTEGKGTVFHIYLPLSLAQSSGDSEYLDGNKEKNATILVVEDEKSVRRVTEKMLRKHGYTVMTAADGIEGLEVYNAHYNTIDLVMLDLSMPKMSGKMFLEKILNTNPNVKVIISSGQSEEEMQKYKQAKGYLSKPYNIDNLIKMIGKVLD